MKRVLITGASGFIGRHCLSSLLTNGYEIHGTFSKKISHHHPDMRWHQIDLLDAPQTQRLLRQIKPTHLLHLAWYATPGKYWSAPENLRWVQASLNLLQLFAQYGGRRVVIAGTCAEYDWNYGYCVEQVTPLAPNTLYGTCKHALQLMAHAFAVQSHLSVVWGRIFFLYGPFEYPSRLVSSVIRSLIAHEPALCSHGNQIRDFLHVQDVADAFVALLDSEVTGPVNIASGQPVSLKHVIYKIAGIFDRSDLVRLGAISSSTNEPALLVANIQRLQREVGWQPKYDLDSGLAQTVNWWLENTPS